MPTVMMRWSAGFWVGSAIDGHQGNAGRRGKFDSILYSVGGQRSRRDSVGRDGNSPKPLLGSLPYIRMYGKVSRSFFPSFLSYIDHGVAAI
jgi:hypothetical protein